MRVRRLATVLDALDVRADGRVATFCWNTARHLELYLAAPCTGRVLHTLNIRLFPEQLVYIANHAEDDVVFVDRSLLPVFGPLREKLTTVRHVVVIDDGARRTRCPTARCDYEELLAGADPFDGRFAVDDEHRAAAMCYTSGTTGNPKGVVYSHRSTVLHSLIALTATPSALSERDVVLPVVPMFHANAWGLPYGALLAGSNLVFPGPEHDAAGDRSACWSGTASPSPRACRRSGWARCRSSTSFDLSALRTILCGGSAVPRSLSEAYRAALGVPILHAWGMTETSPIATVSRRALAVRRRWTRTTRADVRARQGWPCRSSSCGSSTRTTGEPQPWDDEATGELQVAGPWIAAEYYRGEGGGAQFTADGWLRTGDVATIDRYGSVRIVDRTKDLVKSGGEWISSVELENAIMAHPKVAEAAVIGVPHERWAERRWPAWSSTPGETLTAEEVRAHLAPLVPKWWLPDAVEFIDEVPKTSVGKFSKRTLREKFAGYQLPGSRRERADDQGVGFPPVADRVSPIT